jgi:NOL1/NOP2/fmu family ribosome biogenesis protein
MDEAKALLKKLNEYYGSDYEPEGMLFMKKNKLYHYSGDETAIEGVRRGLHIADDDLGLSIEGAQLLGTTSCKNTLDISYDEAVSYFQGQEVESDAEDGYVILKAGSRIVAPAKIEQGSIRNTLPKSRRTKR